jgi:sulfide:quinone oxidoreductase
MVPVALSDAVAVGEMPNAEQIEILATAGFRSILNAQPDGEVERLLSATEAGTLARAKSLDYRHIPIESRRPSDMQIGAFAAALADLPKPIYACCYSGSRAAAAWALAAAQHADADVIMTSVADAGYDVSFLRDMLDARRGAATKPSGSAEPRPVEAEAEVADVPDNVVPLTAAPPTLMPKIIFPIAASAGGYATAR